jgi:hypothetical protein
MTRKEARELREALDKAMEEIEIAMDLRDVPDELIDAVGEAQTLAAKYAEQENLSLSFSGEASELFSNYVTGMNDYYVRITPQEGDPFDAQIIGAGLDVEVDGSTWYDAVSFIRADELNGLVDGDKWVSDLTPEELAERTETLRVADVHIY